MSQLAGYNTQQTVVNYAIQTGTVDSRIAILVAPFGGATVKNIWGFADSAVTGHASNYILGTVYNGGTAGTATTVVAASPGTATGWSADTKTAYTLTDANINLAAGEVLSLLVDIAGSAAPVNLTTIVEWVRGQG
jgi:hypothetical protein